MEIPDQMMIPGIFGYLILLIASIYFYDIELLIFDRFAYKEDVYAFVVDHLAGAWILYSFLYIQILIPGGWHLAKR